MGHVGFPAHPGQRLPPGAPWRSTASVLRGRGRRAVHRPAGPARRPPRPWRPDRLRGQPGDDHHDPLRGRRARGRLVRRVFGAGSSWSARRWDLAVATDPTPFGGAPMAGPEINANAIATLIAGSAPLSDAPAWLDALALHRAALAALGAGRGVLEARLDHRSRRSRGRRRVPPRGPARLLRRHGARACPSRCSRSPSPRRGRRRRQLRDGRSPAAPGCARSSRASCPPGSWTR